MESMARRRGTAPGARFVLAGFAVFLAVRAPRPVEAQTALADPADVATLDGIIAAYYDVVSGPAGEMADRERDRTLHHPDAQVSITGAGQDGTPFLRTMTLDEYHDAFGGARSEPFWEYELHREVLRFGNMATVWSTYASSPEPDGEPFSRGINSIQLHHDGERWWITSWIFDSERAGNPIPAEYLP